MDSPVNFGAALGDLDGDGDLDAFVANHSSWKSNTVWRNDGTGTFADSGQTLGITYSSICEFFDHQF